VLSECAEGRVCRLVAGWTTAIAREAVEWSAARLDCVLGGQYPAGQVHPVESPMVATRSVPTGAGNRHHIYRTVVDVDKYCQR